MSTPVKHASFSIENVYPLPPSQVFAAWADPAAKARWFAGPAAAHSLDFRVGGLETIAAERDDGPDLALRSTYQDIVEDARLIYSSTLSAGDALSTVSTTTVEFIPEDGGTRQILTEHGVFLDGLEQPEWREAGTRDWLDRLAAELDRATR